MKKHYSNILLYFSFHLNFLLTSFPFPREPIFFMFQHVKLTFRFNFFSWVENHFYPLNHIGKSYWRANKTRTKKKLTLPFRILFLFYICILAFFLRTFPFFNPFSIIILLLELFNLFDFFFLISWIIIVTSFLSKSIEYKFSWKYLILNTPFPTYHFFLIVFWIFPRRF